MTIFNPGYSISLWKLGLGVYLYVAIIVSYMMMDLILWNRWESKFSQWASVATKMIMSLAYMYMLTLLAEYRLDLFKQISVTGIMAGVIVVVICYIIIDRFVDRLTAKIFPKSMERLMEAMRMMAHHPKSAFIHICVLAPFMEEVVIRDYFLGGMILEHGIVTSLIASSILFAIIHLNIVQSISAFIGGLILGGIYIYTKGALIPCIIAHVGYNTVSYFTTILPSIKKTNDVLK